MTIYPSELQAMHDAAELVRAICRVAELTLTPLQRDRAEAEAEIWLREFRRRWSEPIQAIGRRLEDL